MQLAKLIIPKKINTLYCFWGLSAGFFFNPVSAQDNSPYSRYGIGDLVPPSNIVSRGMGGVVAGYNDIFSINFNNPASLSSIQATKETKSNKLANGRAILDIGVNIDNRTLKEPNLVGKFTASNALFSYVQIAMPLKKNWGLHFGIRPISRISYNIIRNERLYDPITGLPIDSSSTRFEGDGGAYLISAGTGFSLFSRVRGEDKGNMEEKLSIGITPGYLFGKKNYSTRRELINDSVQYYPANFETSTNYGDLYLTTGLQYKLPLNKKLLLTLGAFGSWQQSLNARQDILRETYSFDETLGQVRLDSVSDKKDIRGELVMPATYTFGFTLQKFAVPNKEGGWLLGLDVETQQWDNYRFYGMKDSVRNKWQVRAGAQLNPVPKRNYFSQVVYRFGLFAGPDYIKVGQKLSQFGASFGMGLPMTISRQAPNQASIINLALEYSRRGNNANILRENMFRLSIGFSLSDIWFIKRKYD